MDDKTKGAIEDLRTFMDKTWTSTCRYERWYKAFTDGNRGGYGGCGGGSFYYDTADPTTVINDARIRLQDLLTEVQRLKLNTNGGACA